MKSLLLTLCLVLSVSAFAGEVVIYETLSYNGTKATGTFHFNKNKDVLVRLEIRNAANNEDYAILSVKNNALSYDAALGLVFLDVDGRLAEVAKLKRFLGQKYLATTGCKFKSTIITKAVETNRGVKNRRFLQVSIVTK
jgi:hypothetical protein